MRASLPRSSRQTGRFKLVREIPAALPLLTLLPMGGGEGMQRAATERVNGVALSTRHQRLLTLGAGALNESELVRILIGPSSRGNHPTLLREGLQVLLTEPVENLVSHHGLSHRQAARLVAASELASRLSESRDVRPQLATPQAIFEWARGRVERSRREEFHVLCLNSRHVLLRHVRVAEGSADQCHVDPREVLAPAVACRATGVVLLHNHPSGDPEPSIQDVALTRQLKDGARLLCVNVVDHLVLGGGRYVSMMARGLLSPSERRRSARLQSP